MIDPNQVTILRESEWIITMNKISEVSVFAKHLSFINLISLLCLKKKNFIYLFKGYTIS